MSSRSGASPDYYAYLCVEYPRRHFHLGETSKKLYINQIRNTE